MNQITTLVIHIAAYDELFEDQRLRRDAIQAASKDVQGNPRSMIRTSHASDLENWLILSLFQDRQLLSDVRNRRYMNVKLQPNNFQ
jgi:hypothetical protein